MGSRSSRPCREGVIVSGRPKKAQFLNLWAGSRRWASIGWLHSTPWQPFGRSGYRGSRPFGPAGRPPEPTSQWHGCDCVSCGGLGWKCASCGALRPGLRFVRGLRPLFAFVRAVRVHETQIRPKPIARNANPTETHRTKRKNNRGARTKRNPSQYSSHETQKQPRGSHQTQFRPRGHARNVNPTSRTGVAASRRSWLHATSLMHRVRSTSCSATASRWSSMRSSWPSLGTMLASV